LLGVGTGSQAQKNNNNANAGGNTRLGLHPILNALFLDREQGFKNTRRDMGNERESRYVLSFLMRVS